MSSFTEWAAFKIYPPLTRPRRQNMPRSHRSQLSHPQEGGATLAEGDTDGHGHVQDGEGWHDKACSTVLSIFGLNIGFLPPHPGTKTEEFR